MERIKRQIITYYDSTLSFFADTLTQSSSKEGFIRYFRNTGWLFIGRMSGMIASFFVGIYVARYLGPSNYGTLNYVFSYVGLFSFLTSFGIDGILNRELVNHPEKRDALLGSGFLIKIIGTILTIIIVSISIFILKSDKLTSILIFLSAINFLFGIFGVIDIYFQSQVLSKNTVKIQILSLLVVSILKIVFILLNLELIYFVLAYSIEGIILSAGLILNYKKMGLKISKWKMDKSAIRYLLINSWPLMFSSVAITVYMKIDQVMITNMISSSANGLYSVAAKLSEIWYFIPGIICTSLFPAIMNAKKIDESVYKKRLVKLYSLMFYLSLGIAVFITLISSFIIKSLFGLEYSGSIGALRIHVWAGIGVFLGYAINQYLMTENLTKIILSTTVIGAITNIILNIILIPKMGINGAAIATLIAYTMQAFSIVFFRKTRGQFILMLKSIRL